MMIAGNPHPVTGRPGKVRTTAIRRATLAGAAVIAEYFRLGGSDQFDSPVDEWNCVRDRWRALRQPYPEAYASLRLAEAELAAGDRRAASRELATAATLAEHLGAAPWRSR
jgi:hypothetical protein